MKTIGEIAEEFCSLYRKAIGSKIEFFAKGEKGKIFDGIIDYLFEKYGEELGYKNTPTDKSYFKSEIINAKNNRKIIKEKNQKAKKVFYLDPYDDDELNEIFILTSFEKDGEGMGESFVLNQIQEFGLNPDSY